MAQVIHLVDEKDLDEVFAGIFRRQEINILLFLDQPRSLPKSDQLEPFSSSSSSLLSLQVLEGP